MKKIICFMLALVMFISASYVSTASDGQIIIGAGKLPFKDVVSGSWYEDAVEFCYVNSIVNGMTENEFRPSGNLTRAQFVTMLCNLEGIDKDEYGTDRFSDVKKGQWYYPYISWAYESGIVSGMSETRFEPNGIMTRAQLALIMKNYMESRYTVETDPSLMDKFKDKPKEEYWYYDAVNYAVSAGLISGITEDSIGATGNVTRAQICRILMIFMQDYKYAGHEHIYQDGDCTKNRVCSVCQMVDGLGPGHVVSAYDCMRGSICDVCGQYIDPPGQHDFAHATCYQPQTCKLCGYTYGHTVNHSFSQATCQAPETCSMCGLTRGEKTPHYFENATCKKPQTCSMCGLTKGKAYEHKSGTWCVFCQEIIADNSYDRIKVRLGMIGNYEPATGATVLQKDTKNSTTWLAYFPLDDRITIENVYYYEEDTFDSIEIIIDRSGICQYIYGYIQDGEYMFMGYGTLDAATYTKNTVEGFGTYRGKLYAQYTENMNMALRQMVAEADELLKTGLGESISGLGFKVF